MRIERRFWGYLTLLDNLYGRSLPPDADVTEMEKRCIPSSMMILDDVTAPILSSYMKSLSSLHLASFLHTKVPILWLVREDGSIALALEEIVDEDGEYAGLYHRGLYSGERKLGHPSLAGDANRFEARIGGELNLNKGDWWITNRSRRYGVQSRIGEQNLISVGDRFKELGIVVKHRYEPL